MKKLTRSAACLLLVLYAMFAFSGFAYADISAEDKEKLKFYKNYEAYLDLMETIRLNCISTAEHVSIYRTAVVLKTNSIDDWEKQVKNDLNLNRALLKIIEANKSEYDKRATYYGYDPSYTNSFLTVANEQIAILSNAFYGIFMSEAFYKPNDNFNSVYFSSQKILKEYEEPLAKYKNWITTDYSNFINNL